MVATGIWSSDLLHLSDALPQFLGQLRQVYSVSLKLLWLLDRECFERDFFGAFLLRRRVQMNL